VKRQGKKTKSIMGIFENPLAISKRKKIPAVNQKGKKENGNSQR